MNADDVRFICEKLLRRTLLAVGLDAEIVLRVKAAPIDVFGLAVRDLIARQPDIFFVQIGAHDGHSHDPLAPYVRQHGWRGLLIEPQPAIFEKLVANYRGQKDLIFENVAVDSKPGSLTLHVFKDASPEEHRSMLASTKRHYLTLNGDRHRGQVEAIQVPAVTINALADRHGITRIDVMQVDTEGHDYTILQSFDFDRFRPQIIHFENNFLHSGQRQRCIALLRRLGYAVADIGIDTLAILPHTDTITAQRLDKYNVVRA